ncbi:MAG: MerC domain-containing protein [Bacteroidota bacterium]
MKNRILYLDQTGVVASLVCAIHCALLPFAITILPLLGLTFLANPIFEIVMIALSLCIGLMALLTSYRSHQQKSPILLLSLGFIFIVLGHLIENTEAVLIPIGGLMIAFAHLVNIKANKNLSTHQHLKDESIS